MKRLIVLAAGLLISTASLYASDNDDIIIRKAAKQRVSQRAAQEQAPGQEELSQEPVPLTEEEQVAVVNKMNLPGMEESKSEATE
jgi:hypothetical protein